MAWDFFVALAKPYSFA